MVDKTDRLMKQFKSTLTPKAQIQQPIATEMFIPNHSGISTHPEFMQAIGDFWRLDGTNDTSLSASWHMGQYTMSFGNTKADPSATFTGDTTGLAITCRDGTGLNYDDNVANTWTFSNAHLISDTDITFDLGSSAVQWRNLYLNNFNVVGGKIAQYNNIATVSNGVPSELATIDRTGLQAAIADTAFYTPVGTGLFRVSATLKVTQAAGTSSVLAGATGITIKYQDADDAVSSTQVCHLANQAGNTITTSSGNTGNTTATKSMGGCIINAKANVGITYACGYTSVPGVGSNMTYSIHLKIEAL